MRYTIFVSLLFCFSTCALAQTETSSSDAPTVPRLVKFTGVLSDVAGKPLSGPADVTFSLYKEQSGGEPLWWETQTLEADAQGRYTVLLGATRPEGLPVEIFASSEARWLAVQVGKEPEQPRVLLVSVPYALKAEEAEKLGGKRASDFVLAEKLKEEVKTAVAVEVQQVGEKSSEQVGSEKGPQPLTGAEGPTDFSGSNSTQIVSATQTGTGRAVHGLIQNAASGATAVRGETNGSGTAVFGHASGTTGGNTGVRGQTVSTAGIGVLGIASATTGTATGVRGYSNSPNGVGVSGYLSATTGYNYALSGISASAQGRGVLAQATSTTGTTIGFLAQVSSPSGVGGTFRNTASGKIITGEVGAGPVTQVFSVDGSGNIVGAGTHTGTRLISTVATGTAPLTVSSTSAVTNLNADLLDGLHAGSFATLGANIFVGNQSITGNVTGSGIGTFDGGLAVGGGFQVNAAGQVTTQSVGTAALADGSVTAAKLAANRLNLSGAAFVCTKVGSQACTSTVAFATSAGSVNNGTGTWIANVALPQGAVVNALRVCGHDFDADFNFTGTLKLAALETPDGTPHATPVVMATTGSSGGLNQTVCYQTTTITNATIDNTLNQYWVEVLIPADTVEFSTVQIDY